MAINPVHGSGTAAAFVPVKQTDQNANNKVNHPAVAPQGKGANEAALDDKAVKKAAPVQPQESKSTVKQRINKFA
ncbi:MAG: hypothetical protein HQL09_05595 [Nitrospirae bacterium]|nr:hypothetical protein [Nitrospirota bacterium]